MNNRTYDVTAIGELLIDFIQYGISEQGNPLFEANPGGAPCNVLAMLQKLGRKTAFIGKVGKDGFGRQLSDAIQEAGITVEGLRVDDQVHTTLSLVHKLPNGDRDFSFYRNPGADMNLHADEVDNRLIEQASVFHFGTLSLTDEPVRTATYQAVETAEKAGCLRSFDPNLRPPLWRDMKEAHQMTEYGLSHCDLLKISDNEVQWFTGKEDFDEGIAMIRSAYPDIRLICLSMGAAGSRAYYQNLQVEVPAFLQEKTVETTGAGDTFGACIIHGVLEYGIDSLDEEKLRKMLQFANAAASIITTRKGALRVMPERAEVEAFLEKEGYEK